MSEPTGTIWYLGAPMEVPLSVLKRLGLKDGDSVTSEGWRQIVKARAGVEDAEAQAGNPIYVRLPTLRQQFFIGLIVSLVLGAVWAVIR